MASTFEETRVLVAESDPLVQETSPNALESQDLRNGLEDPVSPKGIISSPETQNSQSSKNPETSGEEEIENIQNNPDDPE